MSTQRKPGGRRPARRAILSAPAPAPSSIVSLRSRGCSVPAQRGPDRALRSRCGRWRVLAALGDGAARSAAETATRSASTPPGAPRALQSLARGGYARAHPRRLRRPPHALPPQRQGPRALPKSRLARADARTRGPRRLAPAERRQLDRLLGKLERAAATADDGPPR